MTEVLGNKNYPKISVLIAARNEEDSIITCLRSVAALDYPPEKLEVWIGNDQSTDKTQELVAKFISNKSNFFLTNIETNLGDAKGKANVLAHLARLATGELFAITDADVEVPIPWLKAFISDWEPKYGLLTGVTRVKGSGSFAKLQSLDWLNALSLMKLASDVGVPVTAMGNNLLVSKKAYDAVGGYESIPFSVTEDFELFRQITKKGWLAKQLYHHEVLAQTAALNTWQALMQQRKRWMVGAMQIPWYIWMLLALQIAFYPVVLALLFMFTWLGITLWISKLLIQAIWLSFHLNKLKQNQLLPYVLVYEVYFLAVSISSAIYYFLPIAIKWKGRTYL